MKENDCIMAPLCKWNKRYIFSIIIFILILICGIPLTFYFINKTTFCCDDSIIVKFIITFWIFFLASIISRCICITGNKTIEMEQLRDESYYNWYNR